MATFANRFSNALRFIAERLTTLFRPRRGPRPREQVVPEIAERARELATEAAPYRSGALRASLIVQEEGDALAVTSNLDYALFVHRGTGLYGPHQQKITPVRKKALYWPGAGHPFRSVKGQHPQPFLALAYAQVLSEVPDLAQVKLKNAADYLNAELRGVSLEIKV